LYVFRKDFRDGVVIVQTCQRDAKFVKLRSFAFACCGHGLTCLRAAQPAG
jgi:hypothetical protein